MVIGICHFSCIDRRSLKCMADVKLTCVYADMTIRGKGHRMMHKTYGEGTCAGEMTRL